MTEDDAEASMEFSRQLRGQAGGGLRFAGNGENPVAKAMSDYMALAESGTATEPELHFAREHFERLIAAQLVRVEVPPAHSMRMRS